MSTSNCSTSIALVEAERFLTLLDEEAESWCFQTFDDDKDRKDRSLARVLNGTLDQHAAELDRLNALGAGVFVAVQQTDGKGRKAGNITAIRAVFQELDRQGAPEPPLEPHIVVESSPGKFHRYYLTEKTTDFDLFAGVQQRLVDDYGSDPNAKDAARVLRLPGFFHRKRPEAPHRVRIVFENGAQPYTWDVITQVLPNVVCEKRTPPPPGNGLKDRARVESALDALHPDMDYDPWLRVGMGLHHETGGSAEGLELWDTWSARGALYRAGECAAKYGGFGRRNGVTLSCLYKMAMAAGWKAEVDALIGCFIDVEPEPITWLWPDRVALGKLTIIAGEPGDGKSLLSIALAAKVTQGGSWPVDGTPCPQGRVLIISAEDDNADTIRPRLDAAGGKSEYVHFLNQVVEETPDGKIQRRELSLREDLDRLERELTGKDFRLIVIDPISAYLDGVNSWNTAEVRGFLRGLSDLARRLGVAVVMISHFNKDTKNLHPLNRVADSKAFVAASRAAFTVIRDPEDRDRRLFLPLKNNIGNDRTGLAYDVIGNADGVPLVAFHPEIEERTAAEVLGLGAGRKSKKDKAEEWLHEVLGDGPVYVAKIKGLAARDGLSWATVRRAQKELGVVSTQAGFKGPHYWHLPGDNDRTPPNIPNLSTCEDGAPQEPSNGAGFNTGAQGGENLSTCGEFEHLCKNLSTCEEKPANGKARANDWRLSSAPNGEGLFRDVHLEDEDTKGAAVAVGLTINLPWRGRVYAQPLP